MQIATRVTLRTWGTMGLLCLYVLSSHAPTMRGAIIVVDTVGGQRPPVAPSPLLLHQGAPLDFQYCAHTKYDKLPIGEAVAKVLEDVNKLQKKVQENFNFNKDQVLSDIIRYPSLYADVDSLHPDENIPKEPTNWFSILERRKALIDETIRAVGRIEVYNVQRMEGQYVVPAWSTGGVAGTGFYVGNNLVMTNRHVAITFTDTSTGVLKFKKDPPWNREAVVWINFSGTYDGEPRLVRVAETLYIAHEGAPDVALLRLSPKRGDVLPKPVRPQTTEPRGLTVGRPVFVCGFPSWPGIVKPETYNRFQTLRVKRVSLGDIVINSSPITDDNLRHNCATLEGSSGSPLVDLESGTTWGIHSDGTDQYNIAQPMWKVFAIPEVRKKLGNWADGPVVWLESLNLPRTVVRMEQTDRPVVFACQGDVDKNTENLLDGWLGGEDRGVRRENLRRTIPSVGLLVVSKKSGSSGHLGNAPPVSSEIRGTCFTVADGVVVTLQYASDLKVGPVDPSLNLSVDFSTTACHDKPSRFIIKDVIYQSDRPDEMPGVTLLRMVKRPDMPYPPPLPLELTRPEKLLDRHHPLFVVGQPFQDLRTPPEVFNRVFPPPYGVKRISFGMVRGEDIDPLAQIRHDCSTAPGEAGAPLVSLVTGRVVGIHYGGSYLESNFAVPIWKITSDPRFKEIPEIKAGLEKSPVSVK